MNPLLTLLYRRVPALDSLRTYRLVDARADFVAGLTVAAVAVPQAMAYGIAAGVSAEHGLYTAIVMTAVGAVFASSKQLINGPTNVISIAVLSALAGFPPEHKIEGAMILGFLVGSFQTVLTLLRLGDLTRYISHSVVVGFTAGASLLLVLDQFRNLVGWPPYGSPEDHFLYRLWLTWTSSGAPHLETTLIGTSSIAAMIGIWWIKRRMGWPLVPELLIVVVGMAALVWAFELNMEGVKVVGTIPRKLPSFEPPPLDLERVRELSGSALAIATLGLLEALAMAKHISAQTGQRLDLNQLCLSEGLANMSGSFFHCIPGSGSLTRSAINQQAGAVTQWSGVFSAVAVALIVLLFAPVAQYIPRATLAGLLMVSAFRMIDWRSLWFHLRATRFDLAIVLMTAFAAVAISVEFCILIGVVLSFFLAVPRAGRMTCIEFIIGPGGVVRERTESDTETDERIPIFGLEGELFFGSSIALEEHFDHIERRATLGARVIVLRVKRLRNPDAVGLYELERFLRQMQDRGIMVILAGVRQDLHDGLEATGILAEIGPDHVFSERHEKGSSTIEAVRAAYVYLEARESGTPDGGTPGPSLTHYEV